MGRRKKPVRQRVLKDKSLWLRCVGLVTLSSALISCTSSVPPGQRQLMPTPIVYELGKNDPFGSSSDLFEKESPLKGGIVYATDRRPSKSPEAPPYFLDKRGRELHLGQAAVELVSEVEITFEELKRLTLNPGRPLLYPIRVTRVMDEGTIPTIDSPWGDYPKPEDQIAQLQPLLKRIDGHLALSENKDIYIFVNGYRVIFDEPVLVAAEFWHFMGYDGVFMTMSWPSTPSATAYFRYLETTRYSARNFRILLEFLSQHTEAERIHVLGYSAGTRMVTYALHDLSLLYSKQSKEERAKNLRLGEVILVGSDLDFQVFSTFLADGLLDMVDGLTLYTNERDQAMSMSRLFHDRQRLGETNPNLLTEYKNAEPFLRAHPHLRLINVTKAEASEKESGHGYFRASPWVSSDILGILRYRLKDPAKRGLELNPQTMYWEFPLDYPARLRSAATGEPYDDEWGNKLKQPPPPPRPPSLHPRSPSMNR